MHLIALTQVSERHAEIESTKTNISRKQTVQVFNSKQETREYRNLLIHHKMANIQIPEVTRLKIYSNSVVVISINPYLLGMMSTQVWWNPCCQLGEVELHLSSVVEG